MMSAYVYPGITNANYNTAGFYHLVKVPAAFINAGLLCTLSGLGNASLQVSFDGAAWFEVSNFANLALNVTKLMFSGYSGIAGVRIVPPAATTYTLTCCEYYYPVQLAQTGC